LATADEVFPAPISTQYRLSRGAIRPVVGMPEDPSPQKVTKPRDRALLFGKLCLKP
jgi:hypothetical protein